MGQPSWRSGVKPRALVHRAFDGANIGDLRADVEVQKLEGVQQALPPEQLHRRHQFGGGQAELGVFPAGLVPLAAAARLEAHPQAERRRDSRRAGRRQDDWQLGKLLNHQDDILANAPPHQRGADEDVVLVAIGHDQLLGARCQRHGRAQFPLAAHLQTVVIGFARVEDLLHHLAQLVDLDGKHALVAALVFRRRDGALKALVQFHHAVAQDILKPHQHGKAQPARPRLLDQFIHVHLAARVAPRRDGDVPGGIDVEVFRAPAANLVGLQRAFLVPRRGGGRGRGRRGGDGQQRDLLCRRRGHGTFVRRGVAYSRLSRSTISGRRSAQPFQRRRAGVWPAHNASAAAAPPWYRGSTQSRPATAAAGPCPR